MADLVHKWSEEKIPQYEQMMRVGIFSNDEIKSIIKKTTALEYKLVRRVKMKEDYLAYVQYNIHLLSLIRKRRKRVKYFLKKDEIEYAIVSRVHRIFKQCTFRWPEDIKLWTTHIDFCKYWNKKTQLSKIWTTMLQFHGNADVDLWLMAAKWEYEDNHSADNARQIFLRGIRHFPDEAKLWQEYFKMELIHVMKTRQRLALLQDSDQAENPNEEYLTGEAARIVYQNAVEMLDNKSSVKCAFLEIAVPFACFAGEVINMIIKDLYENHGKEASARAALVKLHLTQPMVKLGKHNSRVCRAADTWNAEKRCWKEFEDTIAELNSTEIWYEYMSFLLSRVDSGGNTDNRIIFNSSTNEAYAKEREAKIIAVFQRGHKKRILNSETYLLYVNHLLSTEKSQEAVELLKECSSFVSCKSIWLKLLEVSSSDFVDTELVSTAVEMLLTLVQDMSKVEENTFWCSWATYADNASNKDLLWRGLKAIRTQNPALACRFAIPILKLECAAGIDTAFGLYQNRLLPACPNSIELLDEMLAQIRTLQTENRSMIRSCFEISMGHFGEFSAEFWLRYISFAMKHDRSSVPALHWKAMKTLKAEYVTSFSEGYAILQVG